MSYFADSRQLIHDEASLSRIAGGQNIFGRRVRDLKWLSDIKDVRGDTQEYYNQLNKMLFCDTQPKYCMRQTLPKSELTGNMKQAYQNAFNTNRKNRNHFRDEAFGQGLQFYVSNVEAIMSEIKEIFYSKIRFPQWLPITTNIPVGASGYIYKIIDKYGRAALTDNAATNSPLVGITSQDITIPLRQISNKSSISLRDMAIASFSGISITKETLDVAISAIVQLMEDLILGDEPTYSYLQQGLLNHKNIAITTVPTPWNNLANPEDVIVQLQQAVAKIKSQSNDIFGSIINSRLGFYCSQEVAAFLRAPRTAVDRTIWEAFSRSSGWDAPVELIEVQEFSTASTTGAVPGSNRVLLGYPDANEVWEYPIAEEPRLANSQNQGVSVVNDYVAYAGVGISTLRPGGLLYLDNVFTDILSEEIEEKQPVSYNHKHTLKMAKEANEALKAKKSYTRAKAQKQNENIILNG